MNAKAALVGNGGVIRVTWPAGDSQDLAARWLFDHADEARDPASGQRGHGALALEAASKLEAAEVDGDRLKLRFSPSGAERLVSLSRLLGLDARSRPDAAYWLEPSPFEEAAPVSFQAYLGDDRALREVLTRVVRFGLAILVGADRESGVVERVVERFGFIRETNYGRLFDVRIEARPGNLAYTDRALDLHTDNPYRDPIPTLQLLHAITTDEDGGETLFVDGFAHAEALRCEAPAAFDLLARTPVRFSFAEASGARWSHESPVLTVGARGTLDTVRLNHRSLDLAPGDPAALEAWYDAYLAYYRRLHRPEAAFARRLAPGEVVIFDNRRLVHGRRAMASASPRWLQGCYADMDGLTATLARLDRAAAPEPADGD